VRLFLSLVSKPDAAQRQEACLAAWKDSFSDPEKQGVLDAMWETRAPEYSPALLKVSRGNDSPGIREWALYILGSIDNRQGVEELVPLLSSEPDCEVKRQLLFVFGMYRVKEAVTPIDELLAGNPPGQCTSRQADALRARAQEARDKITGKETRPGWRN
jgi:HEAT repeat protein